MVGVVLRGQVIIEIYLSDTRFESHRLAVRNASHNPATLVDSAFLTAAIHRWRFPVQNKLRALEKVIITILSLGWETTKTV